MCYFSFHGLVLRKYRDYVLESFCLHPALVGLDPHFQESSLQLKRNSVVLTKKAKQAQCFQNHTLYDSRVV